MPHAVEVTPNNRSKRILPADNSPKKDGKHPAVNGEDVKKVAAKKTANKPKS
jgi:hypothetical protein